LNPSAEVGPCVRGEELDALLLVKKEAELKSCDSIVLCSSEFIIEAIQILFRAQKLLEPTADSKHSISSH
jgi:quinolinate synthase